MCRISADFRPLTARQLSYLILPYPTRQIASPLPTCAPAPYHRGMKRHTITSAADAVRGVLRPFTHEDRFKICHLAMLEAHTNADNELRAEINRALKLSNNSTARAAKLFKKSNGDSISQRTLQNWMRRLDMPPATDGHPKLTTPSLPSDTQES